MRRHVRGPQSLPTHPALNSTDALTGDPLVIAEERFAPLGIPWRRSVLPEAVYMSAAYPGVLEPLKLTVEVPCGHERASADPIMPMMGARLTIWGFGLSCRSSSER